MAQQQVLGYDPETGRAVVGYDPNTGKAVFQSAQTPPQTPPPPRVPQGPTPARGTGYDRRNVPENMQRLRNNAPMIGAMAATLLTGGAGWPLIAAAGGGAALGQAIKDAPESMPASDRFENMALSGMGAAFTQGVAGGVVKAAPPLLQGAKNLWTRIAKVTEPVAKSTQTMRMGGTLSQGKDEIAETVLAQGRGTLSARNLEWMRDALNSLDDQVDIIIANSDKLVSRREIAAAMTARMVDFTADTAPGIIQRQALKDSIRILNKRSPHMTVQEAQKAKREIYQFYQKSFPAGAAETATAMAEKVKGSELRSAIAKAEPIVAPLNAQMSRQIPAVKAIEKAVSRTSNHDPVRMSMLLAGVVTNPKTVVSALLNHPKIGSFTAQQIYNAAKLLPKDEQSVATIMRLLSTLYPTPARAQGAGPVGGR